MFRRRALSVRIRPFFESLEARRLLACDILVDDKAGTVLVTGDKSANKIGIVSDQTIFLITCDNNSAQAVNVNHIQIDSKAGDDSVNIDLHAGGPTAGLATAAVNDPPDLDIDIASGDGRDNVLAKIQDMRSDLHLNGNLGSGDDSFVGILLPAVQTTQPAAIKPCVDIAVGGGGGGDAFMLNVGQKDPPPQGAPLPQIDAELETSFDGGPGQDSFSDLFQNVEWQGPITLKTQGGYDPDTIHESWQNFQADGGFDISALGGDGRDDFALQMQDVTFGGETGREAAAHVMLGGGRGDDSALIGLLHVGPAPAPLGTEVAIGANPQLDVDLDMGEGVDSGKVDMQDLGVDLHFNGDLGAGDDSFVGMLLPAVQPTQPAAIQPCVDIAVGGGKGSDTMRLNVGDPNKSGPDNTITSDIEASFDGGAGDDAILIGMSNVTLNGNLDVAGTGGDGRDTFNLMMRNVLQVPGQEVGREAAAHVAFDGGRGADTIGVVIAIFTISGRTAAINEAPTEDSALDIDLTGGDGKDSLAVNFGVALGMRATAHVSLGGGRGNDNLTWNCSCAFGDGSALNLDLLGDQGNDNVTLRSVPSGGLGNYTITTDLGDGRDTFDGRISGSPGNLSLDASGGDGRDNISLTFNGQPTGSVHIGLNGDAGDDVVIIAVDQAIKDFSNWDLMLDGGDGFDILLISSNLYDAFKANPAAIRNFERIGLIPPVPRG